MGTKLGYQKHGNGENTWLNQVFFVLLLRDLEAFKQNNNPSPLSPPKVQFTMSLHPAPTGTCSAKCQRAPGAHLRYRGWISIYWTQNGWECPPTLSQIRKSPLSLDFIVDKAVKSFLPHLQDFSVPAVPNSWEKPGFLACLESLMCRHPLDWEGGSQGSSCSWQQEDLQNIQQKHPTQIGASNPQGGSSTPFCWGRCCGSHLQWQKMGNVIMREYNFSGALSKLS